MTNYNDGKWHGWNGGECPVHPQSEVEVVFTNAFGDVKKGTRRAGAHIWGNPGTHAFRVTKEYREPKELWVNEYPSDVIGSQYSVFDTEQRAIDYAQRNMIRRFKAIEVME